MTSRLIDDLFGFDCEHTAAKYRLRTEEVAEITEDHVTTAVQVLHELVEDMRRGPSSEAVANTYDAVLLEVLRRYKQEMGR